MVASRKTLNDSQNTSTSFCYLWRRKSGFLDFPYLQIYRFVFREGHDYNDINGIDTIISVPLVFEFISITPFRY